MLAGTPILMGDNTIPGIKLHAELKPLIPQIEQACKNFGLDYYPIVVEIVTYSDMSELASYGGFPSRYPHWQFGKEYEYMSKGYEFGQYRISEMVINNSPCYIYCMDSNSLVDNVDVIFHAIGHNDFFKNNVFFEKTHRNMMDKMANHGSSIRSYMRTWGDEKVTAFIDDILRIQTLIDPSSAWKKKKIKEKAIRDKREYHYPNRIPVERGYMDPWLNPQEYLKKEKERVEKKEIADQLELFQEPERDIFAYLKDHAPLKPWQQDIISMLYDEAIYFVPQRQTKMLNEGWASYIDYHFMCKEGYVSLGQKTHDAGIFHYAKHKMQVLGGEYSQNPYKLGFELLLDIEDRYNKGKFGEEYEQCDNMQEKMNWNKNLNLGKQKIFDVRRAYNDYTAIQEFFTPEFCEEKKFFEYKHFPNGETVIVNKDFKSIKKKLLQQYQNGGLPYIRLVDPNHRGKKWFLLEHVWDGRPLYDKYVREVLTAIYRIWGHFVILTTKTLDEKDVVYMCDGTDPETHVTILYREIYEEKIMKKNS
jgi:stage V sporulation protein R